MIASVLQWLVVLLVGGISGGVTAVLILRLLVRSVLRVPIHEVNDPRIDMLARAWAEGSGRPWAAESVAAKLRLLGRSERARVAKRIR